MDTEQMNSPIIDSHCHLEHFEKEGALNEILQICDEMEIEQLITVGTDSEDWAIYHELASKYSGRIHYSVGLHPTSVQADFIEDIKKIGYYFESTKLPCALGEIGLDYFHLPANEEQSKITIEQQKTAFQMQLEIAKNRNCPVIIHSRDAFKDCIRMIDESGIDWNKVVFHCFSEGAEEVKELNAKGGRASFTGIITYKSAENIREAALAQGLNRIMIETDSPYLSPVPKRGKKNQPGYTRYIADFCARLFEMDQYTFSKVSKSNTIDFFGLD